MNKFLCLVKCVIRSAWLLNILAIEDRIKSGCSVLPLCTYLYHKSSLTLVLIADEEEESEEEAASPCEFRTAFILR